MITADPRMLMSVVRRQMVQTIQATGSGDARVQHQGRQPQELLASRQDVYGVTNL